MKLRSTALVLILAVMVVLSAMPVFANAAAVSDFYDFPSGSWSEEAMTAAVQNHLLKGKGDGSIAPKDYITRAEAASVINRAFGATVKANISAFTDVQPGAWYYDEIAKAVNMQTIVGVSATKADPTGYITRESMLSVLARALVLDEADVSELSRFSDGSSVSAWAKGQVAAMAKRGYVNGNGYGQLMPQSYITREEFAQVMHNIFKVYIPDNTIINGATYGTTVIRAKDVTLNHVTINGDLIVGDGVGAGSLNLNDVTVRGRILFRGGEGYVKLINTTVGEKVVINDLNGIVNFLNYGTDEPFKNLQENTKATFLTMIVNSGSSGSVSSKEKYTINEYLQYVDGTYPVDATYTEEKRADYDKTIKYAKRDITGFTLDTSHPDSVLRGSNDGNLVIKAYYSRNKYKVSLEGYVAELPYEEFIRNDAGLQSMMENVVNTNKDNGYDTTFNTKEDGSGVEIKIGDDTQVGAKDLTIYAIKTPIVYNIEYILDGGNLDGSEKTTYTVEDEDYVLPEPTKDGYVFRGWYEQSDFSGDPVAKIVKGSTEDKTYYAKWILDNSVLYFEHETNEDVITLKIMLNVIPADIDDIAAITLRYAYDDTKLDYVSTSSNVGDASSLAGNISWYAQTSNFITEDTLATIGNVLFTVTFNKKSEATGDTEISYTFTEFAASEPQGNPAIATKYTKETETISLGSEFTITYNTNGGTLDGTELLKYTESQLPYTLPIPTKGEIPFLGWYEAEDFSGDPVTEITTGSTGNKTYYAKWQAYNVQFYLGTAISSNRPSESAGDGDRGIVTVEHGAKLTQDDVNRELGLSPDQYRKVAGYTDSDGNVYEITPELWYEKSGEWVRYIPDDVPVVSDMKICLLTRYAELAYSTDLQIKGIDMSKIGDITLTVAYDSNTDVGKTFLNALTNAGITLDRILGQIEGQGYDLYQMAIDKAASKGLVDTDGNILNPNVPIPLHKFITKQFITNEIDAYIDDHIDDDEFIADLISNDHVEAILLADEGLRERLLTDYKSKGIIKEKILDNIDDEALKADIKIVLKNDLKTDTVKILSDSQIKAALISAVEGYLATEGISYVTAEEVVNKYIAGTLGTEYAELYDDVGQEYSKTFEEKYDSYFDTNYEQLIDEHFDSYFEDTVDAYINHTIDLELKTYIEEKILWYEKKLIADFVSGADRTLLHEAIPEYAVDAIEAIKTTSAYNGPIDDFVSGNGVSVNEENLVFIEVLDSIMHTYDYDSLTAEFLPEKIKKLLDFVGRDVAEEYVNEYLNVFCEGMDKAIADLNADLDADIKDTSYKFSTSPAVRINYMGIVKSYYDKLMVKMREKINSQSKIPVSSNPYAQRLVDMDYFELFFDNGAPADNYKSGYKLKDDIMDYYNNSLEVVILAHDAVTYYGNMDEYTLEEKLDAMSQIIGTYANKANSVIMNYINNGELPKGYTPQELADIILDKVLGVNSTVDNAYDKVEDYYTANEEKILDYISKAKTFYDEYLNRDYTDIIDLANMSIYSGEDTYKIYQIILENGENAFDLDDAVTAIFDSPNYRGVSKIEDAMAKIESKIKSYAYTPETNNKLYYVDAYKGTVENREIKGYSTGTHTIALQRYLRYYK